MTLSVKHFTSVTQTPACRCGLEKSRNLLSSDIPHSWTVGISAKVASIVRNEIAPLLPGDRPIEQIVAIVRSLEQILGIAYLADYALEQGVTFRIEAATKDVIAIAVGMGAHEQYVRDQLGPMRALYDAEVDRLRGSADQTLGCDRYRLKSADVVFAQMLALHILGVVVDVTEEDALRSAGAALDVYDDLLDVHEDDEHSGNPFRVYLGSGTSGPHDLFRQLAAPFLDVVTTFVTTRRGSVVRGYCTEVLRRLHAIQWCHHDVLAGV